MFNPKFWSQSAAKTEKGALWCCKKLEILQFLAVPGASKHSPKRPLGYYNDFS